MILGVVCEYNPFHWGHLYHLSECRRAAGEKATLLCVMSGDFVQRGEAAVFSKFARAEAAVACGADLVVELPLPWCLSSAEGFARGAAGLAGALGAERLCFGSESGETEALDELAELVLQPDFLAAVKKRMKADAALSFAAARQLEAEKWIGDSARLLSEPNDILAVEYAKAIRQLDLGMELFAVRRIGSGHDHIDAERPFSASTLRRRLYAGETVSGEVPQAAAVIFDRETEKGRVMKGPDALELPMLARLRDLDEAAFLDLPDAADGLGRRLCRAVREEASLGAILNSTKSKRYPLARVRRLCLCACLSVRSGMADGVPPYARVLAANEMGRALLHERTDSAAIPILTKPAAVHELSKECEALFVLGAQAHDFYVLGFSEPEERRPGGDWRTSPIMR